MIGVSPPPWRKMKRPAKKRAPSSRPLASCSTVSRIRPLRTSISVPFGIAVSSRMRTNFFVPGRRKRTMPRSGCPTPCSPSTGCGSGSGAVRTAIACVAVALAPRGSVTRTPTVWAPGTAKLCSASGLVPPSNS